MSHRPNLDNRPSQTARIVNLLRSRSPEWVPLPEILDLKPRISQFSARIWEARHQWGLLIENKTEIISGAKHSWFRLLEAPASLSQPCKKPASTAETPMLFTTTDTANGSTYHDPEEGIWR